MEGEREWQKCIRVGLKVTVEKKMRGGHSRGRSTPSRKAIGSYSLFASLSLSLSLSHQDPEASRGEPPSAGVLQTRRRHAGRDENFRAPGGTETKLESRRGGQRVLKALTHTKQGLDSIISSMRGPLQSLCGTGVPHFTVKLKEMTPCAWPWSSRTNVPSLLKTRTQWSAQPVTNPPVGASSRSPRGRAQHARTLLAPWSKMGDPIALAAPATPSSHRWTKASAPPLMRSPCRIYTWKHARCVSLYSYYSSSSSVDGPTVKQARLPILPRTTRIASEPLRCGRAALRVA
jgi:hypothetical protein